MRKLKSMSDNFVERIIEDIKSDTPGRVIQAILTGTEKKITDERFIDAVKSIRIMKFVY